MTSMARTMAALLICAAASSPTWASQPPVISKADARRLESAASNLEKGRRELTRVARADTNSERLYALDRALLFLRRARTTALKSNALPYMNLRENVDDDLVAALNAQTEIYYGRKSLNLAEKRNTEAISVDPRDPQARIYTDLIAEAKSTDIYTEYQGSVAVNRIRDRRADVGLPLRDRGIATRR